MNVQFMPGTTIEVDFSHRGIAKQIINPMFLAGGLVLSQVSSLTGLEPYVLQNWVKRGFLPSPVNKKYSKRQFCRIAIISFLKECLQIDRIVSLIGYVNGDLSQESDDIIDDSDLYSYFLDTIVIVDGNLSALEDAIEEVLSEYREPYPGAHRKVGLVLQVMVILYHSTRLKARAELIMKGEFNLEKQMEGQEV